jgi:hypothetical protein
MKFTYTETAESLQLWLIKPMNKVKIFYKTLKLGRASVLFLAVIAIVCAHETTMAVRKEAKN